MFAMDGSEPPQGTYPAACLKIQEMAEVMAALNDKLDQAIRERHAAQTFRNQEHNRAERLERNLNVLIEAKNSLLNENRELRKDREVLDEARAQRDGLGQQLDKLRELYRERYMEMMDLREKLAAVLGLEDLDHWVSRHPLPCPPQLETTVQAFIAEYWRAKHKHGEMTMDGKMTGNAAADTVLRLAALMEEVGEVATELTYDGAAEGAGVEGGQLGRLMKELIQVMNVAGTWHSYLVPGPTIDRYGHTKADHEAAGACVRPPVAPAPTVTPGVGCIHETHGGLQPWQHNPGCLKYRPAPPAERPAEPMDGATGDAGAEDGCEDGSDELVAQAPIATGLVLPGRFVFAPGPKPETITFHEAIGGAIYQCPACKARSAPNFWGIRHLDTCPLQSVRGE